MQAKWTANQLKYQHWLAQSKYDRLPPTKELFASELGVDAATLWRWEQKPGWAEAVTQIALNYLQRDTAEVLQALAREAKKGSIQHIKEFLSLVGIVGEQPTQNVTQHVVIEYADDTDIVAEAATVAERCYQDSETV